MKITPELLLQLGAKQTEDGDYELLSHGNSFKFTLHTEASVNNGQPMFQIHVADNWHWITDIEECFGFIADDYFVEGRKNAKEELLAWLHTED